MAVVRALRHVLGVLALGASDGYASLWLVEGLAVVLAWPSCGRFGASRRAGPGRF